MKGRSFQDETYDSYRFGFNGKENDTDFGNKQLVQDYGFRIYNPAIAKFLSVDPLMKSYPTWTPYAFAMNRVIDGIDLEGLEYARQTTKYSDHAIAFSQAKISKIEDAVLIAERQTVTIDQTIELYEIGLFDKPSRSNVKSKLDLLVTWPNKVMNIADKDIATANSLINYDCFSCTKLQLKNLGYKTTKITEATLIYHGDKGVSSENTVIRGLNVLLGGVEKGVPIAIGLDYKDGDAGNPYNGTTDHWVTVYGAGKDKKGFFVKYLENASSDVRVKNYPKSGTASEFNKLYLNTSNLKLKGNANPSLLGAKEKRGVTATEIRPSKKINK